MGGMEGMVLNMLRAMGFDPEAMKKEIATRVADFEKNIATLNEHLLQTRNSIAEQNLRLANIEKHFGIERQLNGTANENGIRQIEGPRDDIGTGDARE